MPDVSGFALDQFPDELPSQLVRTGPMSSPNPEYAFYAQGIASARWSRDKVRLPSTGTPPHLVASHTSSVTILDRRGTPMPFLPVRVSAESLAEIQIDGVSYLVGPGSGAAVATNAQGKVVISAPADGPAPAILHVDAAGLPNGAVIQPAADVHRYLGGAAHPPRELPGSSAGG